MPADQQLERLLYILPAANRPEGAAIADLARALGVDARTILRDLEEATSRVFYQPPGAADTFMIFVEGDRVRVHSPDHFQRPVRLNAREALALGLGLRALAAEAEPERRREILALASRLEEELTAPTDLAAHGHGVWEERVSYSRSPGAEPAGPLDEDDVEYEDDLLLAYGDDGFRGVVADAIELGRVCTLWYLKPSAAAPEHRRIAPYRLVHAQGQWYVASHDLDRDELRFFRMDRVLDAQLAAEPAPDVPEPDLRALLANGAAYVASEDVEVRVRYSPKVARWIAEQGAVESDGNGGAIVRHRVADRRWVVRHVLAYAGEAVVEGPAEARGWVEEAAGRLAGQALDVA